MAQGQDFGTIAWIVIIVIGFVFSIVQALLKGKKFNLETIFNPDKPAHTNTDANEIDFTTFNDEPIMVVDAQGNLITKAPPQRPPAPPMKNRRKKCPTAVKGTVKVDNKTVLCQSEAQLPDNYIDLIRNHANSAIIMHEILGKPKALQ